MLVLISYRPYLSLYNTYCIEFCTNITTGSKPDEADALIAIRSQQRSSAAMVLLSLDRGSSDMKTIALALAGNTDLILWNKFSLEGGIAIAYSIFDLIANNPNEGPESFYYLTSLVDYCMLLKRVLSLTQMINQRAEEAIMRSKQNEMNTNGLLDGVKQTRKTRLRNLFKSSITSSLFQLSFPLLI